MAKTWLEQFSEQLSQIEAKRGAQMRGSDSRDAIYSILASRVQDAKHVDFEKLASSSGGSNDFSEIGRGVLSGGQRILDLLGRGNYASANMSKYLQEHQNNPEGTLSLSGLKDLADLPGAFGAAAKGFAGKEKVTYADVNKGLRNKSKLNNAAVGGLSFLEDVVLDPTTYIGPGAVKGVAKLGGRGLKAAGVNIPKFARPKNAEALLTTEKVLTPVEKAEADIVTKGTTEVPATGNVTKLINELNKKAPPAVEKPYDIAPLNRQIEGPKARFIADAMGVVEDAPWRNQTARLKAQIGVDTTQAQLDELLKGVKVKKYPDVEKLSAPFKETTKTNLQKVRVEKTREIPTTAVVSDEPIKQELRKLATENFNRTTKKFDLYGRSGLPYRAALKTGSAKTLDEPLGVSPKQLLDWTKSGNFPKGLAEAHIKVDGKLVKLTDHLKELHNDYKLAETFGDTTPQIEKYFEEVDMPFSVKSVEKLGPLGYLLWQAKHKDIIEKLDPADLTKINRVLGLKGGPKHFERVLNELASTTTRRDFNSVEELMAAHKAGHLSEDGLQLLKTRLQKAGVKSPAQLQKKLDRAREALVKAANSPTPVNKAKASKAVLEATNSTGTKIEMPDVWTSPALVDAVQTKVEKVLSGDTAEMARPRAELDERMARAVETITREVNAKEFVEPLDRTKYGFESRTGTKRTRPTPGAGLGRNIKGFNKFSQVTLGKRVIAEASKIVRGTPAAARPAAMYDTVMPMLNASEQVLRQNGIPIIIGKGATGLPLSIHDVLSSLPRDFVERYYFTPQKSLGITQLADIAEQAVHRNLGHIDEPSMRANISNLLLETMGRNKIESPLTRVIKTKGGLNEIVDEFVQAFTDAAPSLNESLSRNSAEAVIKTGQETKALTDATISAFNETVTNPHFGAGPIMEAALNMHRKVNSLADEMNIPVSSEARVLSEQAVAAQAAETVPMASVATHARGAEKFRKATTNNDSVKVAEELSKSADTETQALMRESNIDVHDLGIHAEYRSGVAMFRAFFPHLGNELLRPILTARMSVVQTTSKQFTGQLGKINATHTAEDIRQAFAALQEGKEITTPAMEAMALVMKQLFDTSSSKYGLFSRNFSDPYRVTEKFKKFGIPEHIKIDPKNMDESWRKWEVEDPLDLMSRFHAAVNYAVAEREIGAQISSMFGRTNPGNTGKWVKIRDPRGQSKLATLLRQDLYYPSDIADQMHLIDKTLTELMKPAATNKFLQILDSALHAYKAGVTIYRPGHHIRNMTGDIWLSSMDGVGADSYKNAAAALATRHTQYADFDSMRALKDAYKIDEGGQLPKTILTTTHKGKKVSFSPEQVYRMAFDNGVLPDYSVLEDVAFGTTEQADKIASTLKKYSPFQGKIHKAATKTSEYRDHYIRLAHFIHAMRETPLNSGVDLETALQHAAFEAGHRVRKWHPDGSDLSQFEKQYMRRGILFYSWVRKAIPLVVESAVMRPGRFMAYPKAMQNIAAANGIDLSGFGNPFPVDQLFPDYIADSTQGPQWGEAQEYAGIKPGIPSMDVLDDYAASPKTTLQSIMGSTNPLFKIPAEVATDTSLRTGAPIADTSEYVDQQLPLGSYLDKLTGRSASSGFTQPLHVAKSNIGYKGNPNTGGNLLQTIINLLSGGGVTDYSKPSMIKNAQLDEKRRLMGGR